VESLARHNRLPGEFALVGVARTPMADDDFANSALGGRSLADKRQLQGGIVWGVSLALHEHSVLDQRTGRFVNANLAEYHVPVNADIGRLDVTFIDEPDLRFNPLGARGIGEIGITGVPAALCNAVYHATGRRIRELPITLDKLL